MKTGRRRGNVMIRLINWIQGELTLIPIFVPVCLAVNKKTRERQRLSLS